MTEAEFQYHLRAFDRKIQACLKDRCPLTAARWQRDKEAFINEYKQAKTENR